MTPEEIWLQAEKERCRDDTEISISVAVRYSLAQLVSVDVGSINDATPLPPDDDLLKRLYGIVMLKTALSSVTVSGNSRTVGELITEMDEYYLRMRWH